MGCRLRIGLTGGIGSGKSEVAHRFARLGAAIIDTDVIARELVEPGQPALKQIVDTFGSDLLDASGQLIRDKLRQRVFADPAGRHRLEAILHPLIRERTLRLATQSDAPYCILVIPLLVETNEDYELKRVLLVDCPEAVQRQRVRERDHLSDSEIDAIMAAQASRAERLAIADDVVVNNQQLPQLDQQVLQLHRGYLRLAKQADRQPRS
jgi:dephospho-CoA kinase